MQYFIQIDYTMIMLKYVKYIILDVSVLLRKSCKRWFFEWKKEKKYFCYNYVFLVAIVVKISDTLLFKHQLMFLDVQFPIYVVTSGVYATLVLRLF